MNCLTAHNCLVICEGFVCPYKITKEVLYFEFTHPLTKEKFAMKVFNYLFKENLYYVASFGQLPNGIDELLIEHKIEPFMRLGQV